LRIWENKRASAEKKLNSCEKEYQEKTEKYEFLREEYRISLEEKKVNKPLYNEYTKAKDEYEKAKSELSSAEKEYEVLSSKVGNLRDIIREKEKSAFEGYEKAKKAYDAKVLGLRLVFFMPLLILSIVAYVKIKSGKFKQYIVLGESFLAFSIILTGWSILAFVSKIIDMMLLSLMGGIACAAGLMYMIKQLQPTIMLRRILDDRCPWCSTPIKGNYCIKCGRCLVEKCKTCGKEKRILIPHCPNCGA
jgi:hypothetical protein